MYGSNGPEGVTFTNFQKWPIHFGWPLFMNLPDSLPLDPTESTYHFHLDEEDIKKEGMMFAFNHHLEVCFQAYKLGNGKLLFTEWGKHIPELKKFIKNVVKTQLLPEARSHLVQLVVES
ncbi:hypothetical protein DFH07DRAFT_766949 [Mycena maculata]|uniref:Uncharacterized protein n=1 Tax=Mycena maculata TaxID=230809 RepID=A0AAD7K2U7_9AGAR|nr:hypothetical protein DFH07DRAFT_766949 [Mycena maculata]